MCALGKGTDVSEWQGGIDFGAMYQDLLSEGEPFCGIRYGDGSYIDSNFDSNMTNAINSGFKQLLTYHFSRADNADEAREEASRIIAATRVYGENIIIAIDLEDSSRSDVAEEVAEAFVDQAESMGFKGKVYASTSWWNSYLSKDYFSERAWAAQYGQNTGYQDPSDVPDVIFGIWQYSSAGSVAGIDGNVDVNWLLKDWWGVANPVTAAVDTEAPTSDIPITDCNPCFGDKYNIYLHNVQDNGGSGVQSVKVAVWTLGNGQDDLQWYDMLHSAPDQWMFTVDLKQHGRWLDTYMNHIYIYDGAGNQTFAGAVEISVQDADLKATADVKVEKQIVVDNDSATNRVNVHNIQYTEMSIDEVRVACWKDDEEPVWNNTPLIFDPSNNSYSDNIFIPDRYKGSGKYNVHVYGWNRVNDKSIWLGLDTFTVISQEERDAQQDKIIADLKTELEKK
ncbi:GH25 family lysozyme [Acetobacterium tundrae]|uniref:Uncharacterized protein n=1 Tax=Acetobacterium tundrae TaxID=132932 RepID=A0ABR6WND6_9FIRM|nr:GH25 family lysozyme [Acetobacterium tundrae]MBC3798008.1 hypothetical protein [Acetobacterium tundrae]